MVQRGCSLLIKEDIKGGIFIKAEDILEFYTLRGFKDIQYEEVKFLFLHSGNLVFNTDTFPKYIRQLKKPRYRDEVYSDNYGIGKYVTVYWYYNNIFSELGVSKFYELRDRLVDNLVDVYLKEVLTDEEGKGFNETSLRHMSVQIGILYDMYRVDSTSYTLKDDESRLVRSYACEKVKEGLDRVGYCINPEVESVIMFRLAMLYPKRSKIPEKRL